MPNMFVPNHDASVTLKNTFFISRGPDWQNVTASHGTSHGQKGSNQRQRVAGAPSEKKNRGALQVRHGLKSEMHPPGRHHGSPAKLNH